MHQASLHQKGQKMVSVSLSHGKLNTQCTQEMTTKGVSVILGEMERRIVHKWEKTMIRRIVIVVKMMTRIMTIKTMIAMKVKMSKMKVEIMILMILMMRVMRGIATKVMKEIIHLMVVLLVIS